MHFLIHAAALAAAVAVPRTFLGCTLKEPIVTSDLQPPKASKNKKNARENHQGCREPTANVQKP
jgi:preprotein translocase subunit Sec63